GALKHLTDQYIATFSLADSVLAKAGLDRAAMARAFVEQDIALRGFLALSEGRRDSVRRAIHFALAAYPDFIRNFFGLPPTRKLVCGISFGYADGAHPIHSYRTERTGLQGAVTFVDS
ncbi:MAG: hypothetical protein ABI612_07055, partial [Betaproteobacteria bacterium]